MNYNWNNMNTGIDRQKKATLFKRLDIVILTTGAFGEDYNGHPISDNFCRLIEALYGRFAIGTIDTYITRPFHGISEKWYSEKLSLCKPSKLNREVRHKYRNIKIAQMVGHVNVRTGRIYIGKAFDGNLDAACYKYAFRPNSCDFMYSIAVSADKGD